MCGREFAAAEVVYTLPTVVSPAAMVFRLVWCDGPRPERASISADTTEDDPHASRSSANASSHVETSVVTHARLTFSTFDRESHHILTLSTREIASE